MNDEKDLNEKIESTDEPLTEETVEADTNQYDETTEESTTEEFETYSEPVDEAEPLPKKKKKGILKYIIAAVVLLVAFKSAFEFFGNDKKMPETSEAELVGKIDLDTSSKYDFISFGNNVVMCNKYGVFAYNSGGKNVWKYETNLTYPVMYVCGKNLLVTDTAQSNAKVFDESGRLKNEITFENDCINAVINENGWVTATLKLRGYKAQIAVYDNTSKLKYSWSSANNDVIYAGLAKDNKTLAAAQLDSSSASEAYGIISLFDITTDGKPYCGKNLENNIVTYMRWSGDKLVCVGTKNTFKMDKNGNETWSYTYPGEITVYNAKNDYAMAFGINGSSTTSAKTTKIYIVSSSGKELGFSEIEGDVRSVEIYGDSIEVINSANIITLRKDASVKKINNLSRDISKCCIFGSKSKVFVVSGTTAEILSVV